MRSGHHVKKDQVQNTDLLKYIDFYEKNHL